RVVPAPASKLSADDRRANFEVWKQSVAEFLSRNPTGWQTLAPVDLEDLDAKAEADAQPAAWKVHLPGRSDEAVLFTGNTAPVKGRKKVKAGPADRVEFALEPGTVAAIRLELLPH